MACKVCGGQTNVNLCEPCFEMWSESAEFERYKIAPPGCDNDVFDTSIADFVRRVRAERENGGRAGAKEVTP